MSELVTFEKGEVRTTSLILAEGTGNQHHAIIQLVRKYQDDLEEFGRVAFQMRPFETAGGTQTREIAMLNEQQATLIMTYMKNTPIVREFKKALVRAFFELRDIARSTVDKRVDVNMTHTRGITNQHGLDIKYNLDLTKVIQHPTRTGLALLERLTGINLDDIIAAPREDSSAELFANFVKDCCVDTEPTKRTLYKPLYQAFAEWSKLRGYKVPSVIWFSKQLVCSGYQKSNPKETGGSVYVHGIELA